METTINLFQAKAKIPAKAKTEKPIVKADILDDKIQLFNTLKNELQSLEGRLKMIEGDIKATGKELFLKEYRKIKTRPENFKIQDKTGSSCLFICMDKYTTVDETKAEVLNQFPDLVEQKQTFKINPELVEKYASVLSGLIVSSPDIEDEDKLNLIQGEMSYCVKKGSIDRLMQYDSPEIVFELINPIVSLKK